jgi:hypothetical protein
MFPCDLFQGRSYPEKQAKKTTVVFSLFVKGIHEQHCIDNYLKLLIMIKQKKIIEKTCFFYHLLRGSSR